MNKNTIYTVTQISNRINYTFEKEYNSIFIKGEISSFVVYNSGHAYFKIKDNNNEINCIYFNYLKNPLNKIIENVEVVIFGSIAYYKKKGKLQIVVSDIHLGKDGQIWYQFLQLKEKLKKEGLFDLENKKTLPQIPENIAIISSTKGAVVHDIEKIIKRRSPYINVHFFDTPIQGDKCISTIPEIIKTVNKKKAVDLIILARGGGSFEDLMIFNEESIIRSIFSSKIPIITAIGHQTDITLSDYVSDKSAATPSEAAEICSPSLNKLMMKLNFLDNKIHNILKNNFFKSKDILNTYTLKISSKNPKLIIHKMKEKLLFQDLILKSKIKDIFVNYNEKLRNLDYELNNYNINKMYKRGFSIIRKNGKIVNSIKDINVNDNIDIKLLDGYANSLITKINEEK